MPCTHTCLSHLQCLLVQVWRWEPDAVPDRRLQELLLEEPHTVLCSEMVCSVSRWVGPRRGSCCECPSSGQHQVHGLASWGGCLMPCCWPSATCVPHFQVL
jgi:hypothetical protein